MTFQEDSFSQNPLASIPNFRILECIIGVSFTVFTVLLQLPYEYIGENPVPTVIFKDRPTTFHAFLICVVVAFTGATKAIVSPNKSKIGRFCGYFSMASMASAFAILFWAIYCSCAT